MRPWTMPGRASVSATLLLVAVLAGCGDSALPATTVVEPGQPSVTVTLASAVLGQDCGGGGTSSVPTGGACLAGHEAECRAAACMQSSVQMKVSATDGQGRVTLQVMAVRVRDENSNAQLDQLAAREPQKWSGGSYVSWDQTVGPLDDFAVTYKMTAPNWSGVAANGGFRAAYRVEVDLLIGGQARTITLDGVTHAAPIAT